MSTARQRQQAREDEDIERILTRMRESKPTAQRIAQLDQRHGQGYSRTAIVAAVEARRRLNTPRSPTTQEQLAIVARQLETIVAAEHKNPETGETHTVEKTKRAVSLVDMMQKDNLLPMDLHQAADQFRTLFFKAMGSSKGVSSYGEYTAASEPSGRLPTSAHQMQAYDDLKRAALAAFGTFREDGRWTVDEQLMHLVVPAILSDKKDITQGAIGQQRTRYTGAAQVRSAGGVVVHEVLQRLSLHFIYRER